ncbi:MAG: hypothetical protein ACREYF_17420 [Gammaproteobacteria bacterium]
MQKSSAVSRYEDCVFLNVPFDKQYLKILHAICFAIHDCGYVVRIAVETTDTHTTRLNKILSIIEQSKHCVSDLSRMDLGSSGYPRFNMPFEAGLWWGAFRFGRSPHPHKRLLVMDVDSKRYQGALSDIAGQDIQSHSNDPEKAIACVRTFLASDGDRRQLPGAASICKRHSEFRKQLPKMAGAAHLRLTELRSLNYIPDYLVLLAAWLRRGAKLDQEMP